MTNSTQLQFIKNVLIEQGSITRNFALTNYISRLSALIAVLKNDGWIIEGRYIPVMTPFGKGKDYQYVVFKRGDIYE